MTRGKLIGLVLRILLAFVLGGVLVATATASRASASERSELLNLVNRARVSRGLHRLDSGRRLERLAQRHTRRMARTGRLFHSRGLSGTWGENVGYTFKGVRNIHRAFMRSLLHRVNILGPYRRVGLGLVQAGRRLWVTELFQGRKR